MYISRPRIDGLTMEAGKQLADKPSVKLHRGKGNVTTQMVMDRDDAVRHPITKQWLSRYQNQQSEASTVPVTNDKDSQEDVF